MIRKIKHLFQRLAVCVKAYPGDCREFGWRVALLRFWDVWIPRGKSKRYIEVLSAYMIKELAPLVEKYNHGEIPATVPKRKLDKVPVWTCWWQGEGQMPPLVRACMNRLHSSLPVDAQLHLITWDNVDQYMDLPEYVIRKHHEGLIGLAHLSDILRFGLLSTYGGAWVDATVYLSKQFPKQLYTESFYTQRFASGESCPQEACRGKWCGFFFGGQKDNVIFPFMYEALCDWWSRHDRVVDYVFFDYILWAAYSEIPEVRRQIDAVPPGNENVWKMWQQRNTVYDPASYRELLSSNDFFKLSYNGQLDMETEDGRKTVYAHILEENNGI